MLLELFKRSKEAEELRELLNQTDDVPAQTRETIRGACSPLTMWCFTTPHDIGSWR